MRPIIVDFLAGFVGHDAAALLAPTYFTLVALAGLAAALLMVRRARAAGDDVPTVLNTIILGYTAAVVGGILLPMLFDVAAQLAAGRWPRLRWAGMVAYGGFAGALLAVVLYLRRGRPLSLARFGDLLAPAVGLCVAVVRCGCFVAGCDYGKVTDAAWAVRFPAGSPAFRDHVHAGLVPGWRDASLPVHPTQLYESLLGVALCLGMLGLARSRWVRAGRPGLLLPLALAGYALGRSAIESLRGDASRGFLGPLSTSQVISALVLAVVAYALWSRLRQARAAVAAAALVVALVGGAPAAHAREWQGGVLFGTTNAINRPDGQVPQFVGAGFVFDLDAHAPFTMGAELEVMSNSVAQHSCVAIEAVWRQPLSSSFHIGVRGGIGYTAINFHDASFAPRAGLDLRVMGTVDLRVSESWRLSMWPVAFESVQAPDMGGPIVAYQFRIGLSYTFGRPKPPPAPPPQVPYLPAPGPAPAPVPAPAPPPPTDTTPERMRPPPPTPTRAAVPGESS